MIKVTISFLSSNKNSAMQLGPKLSSVHYSLYAQKIYRQSIPMPDTPKSASIFNFLSVAL